jgi:hypothetical protein
VPIYRRNPLTPQDVADLAPLENSHKADQLELEMDALDRLMFDTYIRPGERTVNTLGTPHIGSFDQVERAVKAEGLALQRRGGEAQMRYLFRAWRARNPKRGLHMLRAYLQLLWPNGWTMNQMWQDIDSPYPTLAATDEGNHYLTSRVQVTISGAVSDGADVQAAAPSLRSVLAAKYLLNVSLSQDSGVGLALAPVFYAGCAVQFFEGDFYRDPEELAMAQVAYQGAAIEQFEGNFT